MKKACVEARQERDALRQKVEAGALEICELKAKLERICAGAGLRMGTAEEHAANVLQQQILEQLNELLDEACEERCWCK